MSDSHLWRPSADIETLKARASIIDTIRAFFKAREILEVDVPLLSQGVALDPGLHAFSCSSSKTRYFLQTSPEFAMKRLLAAGSGPIYYLGKACRFDEMGRWHNPEFTMLEWYRPGWLPDALIQETSDLLSEILHTPTPIQTTYQALFETYFGVNPHQASASELMEIAKAQDWYMASISEEDKASWLDLLFSHGIEPKLGWEAPSVVVEFPICQASLSKGMLNTAGEWVAARFEFYLKGMELANGYHELTDPRLQLERFENDLAERSKLGIEANLPIDYHLVNALEAGMPDSCGIALGVDRLMMIALQKDHIKEILAFDFERA
ncbi:MAG: EF-P lysine aminoacylase EpmA [Gammaproteobacteria bacterium]